MAYTDVEMFALGFLILSAFFFGWLVGFMCRGCCNKTATTPASPSTMIFITANRATL